MLDKALVDPYTIVGLLAGSPPKCAYCTPPKVNRQPACIWCAMKSAKHCIGELRSMLSQNLPRVTVWREMTQALDQCEPGELEALVAYVEGHVGQWPKSPSHWEAMHGATMGVGLQEVRRIPGRWVQEILDGRDSLKFQVGRVMMLSQGIESDLDAQGVWDCVNFTHLQVVRLGAWHPWSRAFFHALARSSNLPMLEALEVQEGVEVGRLGALDGAESLKGLRHLYIKANPQAPTPGLLARCLEMSWVYQLETLGYIGPERFDVLGHMAHHLPSLRRLVFCDWNSRVEGLSAPACHLMGNLTEVVLLDKLCEPGRLRAICAFLGKYAGGLESLDLRGLREEDALLGSAGVALFGECLFETGLADTLSRVMLPDFVGSHVREMLAAKGLIEQEQPSLVRRESDEGVLGLITEGGGFSEQWGRADAWVRELGMNKASEANWESVVALSQRLEVTLRRQDYAVAMEGLNQALLGWPDELRRYPVDWLPELMTDPTNPRLSLGRCLVLPTGYWLGEDKRCMALWLDRLFTQGNLEYVKAVEIGSGFPYSKGLHKCVKGLFEMLPDVAVHTPLRQGEPVRKTKDILVSALADEDQEFLPSHEEWYQERLGLRQSPFTSDVEEAFASPFVRVVIQDDWSLRGLFQMRSLEHVVSLDIRFGQELSGAYLNLGHFEVEPVHVPNLVSLRLGGNNEQVRALMYQWLQHARPVEIAHFIDLGQFDRPLMLSRTSRATLDWRQHDPERLLRWVRQGVRAHHILGAYFGPSQVGRGEEWGPSYPRVSLVEFARALSSESASALRRLDWYFGEEDLVDLEESLGRMPSLRVISLRLEEEAQAGLMDRVVEALAGVKNQSHLGVLALHSQVSSSGGFRPFTVAQRRTLERAGGIAPEVVVFGK